MNARVMALAAVAAGATLAARPAAAQDDHARDEGAMFGAPAPTPAPDAGAPAAAPAADAGAAAAAAPEHDEGALFGAPAQPTPTPPTPVPGPDAGAPAPAEGEHSGVEGALFGGPAPAPEAANEAVPMDPLKLGGTLYLRGQVSAYKDTPPSKWGLDVPNLLDVYLDARPNDRVRGMVVGRLTYDPTIDPTARGFTGAAPRSQTNAFLDQLWLNFDVARTVFVTAGKQHVKWGTGHFWNPTDFLQPVRLDPLAVYDERTGVTMIKAHVPWEARNWNFYGFALLEGPSAANLLGRVGGAARAELLLGPAEVGLEWTAQQGRKPRYGVDVSSPVGPIDVYAEAAFRDPHEDRLWRLKYDTVRPELGLGNFEQYSPDTQITGQLTAGASWQENIGDNNAFTLGAEYFYNPLGADNPILYPWLILQNEFTPFYAGQHYAGLYALLLIPTSDAFASNAFVFSTLSNLSDKSFITRLDYSITVLTHLRVEAYGDVHYGTEGGEFRFGFNSASIPASAGQIPAFFVPTPVFDLGLALRISI